MHSETIYAAQHSIYRNYISSTHVGAENFNEGSSARLACAMRNRTVASLATSQSRQRVNGSRRNSPGSGGQQSQSNDIGAGQHRSLSSSQFFRQALVIHFGIAPCYITERAMIQESL